ncbi:Persistence and stress-resistance antitoxin PasI [invertebrate metagenome]|uniref:Persistence and stress-resistance antitoxin PasI n=1 Tax=invertebrate metagenome TaxID=1711999 RepID=A0A2H9T2S4_9ZZZZ
METDVVGKEQDKLLTIEVAYARSDQQKVLEIEVSNGTSVHDAVKISGMMDYFPELDIETAKLGIFGKVIVKGREHSVKAGDRVEIYRPLLADPKEVRRRRAEQARNARQTK